MATDKTVNELIINKLTQAQYDAIPEAERSDTELYFITDADENALPDQTDNAGKFLMTDGENASWSEALVNKATGGGSLFVGGSSQGIKNNFTVVLGDASYCSANRVVVIGNNSNASGYGAIVIGGNANASAENTVAIGTHANASAKNAIQLGGIFEQQTNSDANTFKVGNENGNFEMMDANGKVPLDRLTYVTDQIGDISTALTAILGE